MKRNEIPSKEEIIEYYIKGLHTVQECADYFNIGKTKFYRCLKLYDITRSQEDKSAVYSRIQNTEEVRTKIVQANLQKYGAVNKIQANRVLNFCSEDSFVINGTSYTREWFFKEYCINNTPLKKLCEELGISTTIFYQICQHYNIKKTNQQRLENIQKTVNELYNVKSTLQLPEVRDKSRESLVCKYGVDNPTKSSEVREKIKQTCMQKYGVSNFSQTEEYRIKTYNTNLKKYGSPNHMQQNMKHLDVWNNKDKLKEYLESLSMPTTIYDLMLYFNLTDRTVVYERIHTWQLDQYVAFKPARSHYETDIVNWLKNECEINNIALNE